MKENNELGIKRDSIVGVTTEPRSYSDGTIITAIR